VALLRTEVSEARIASIIKATKISELIFVTFMMEAIRASETSVLTIATRRHIPEDDIVHSQLHENPKSYKNNPAFQFCF
jgi:thiazole synthase ThiGH ThiG subunit